MSDRKVFKDSVVPLPDQEGLTRNGLMIKAADADHRKEVMTILFSLAIPPLTQSQLEERVARGEVVPLADLKKLYAPNATEREALVAWFKNEDFEISQVSEDGTSVYARGRVDQIEKSLAVTMTRVTKDGITYTAARNAPSMPAEVGKTVQAISGLQPFVQAHKQSRKCAPTDGNRLSLTVTKVNTLRRRAKKGAPRKVKATRGVVPSPNIQNAPPYLVNELLKAYGADGLSVTGKGQTIAIMIDTFPADADLRAFLKRNSLPTGLNRIEKINVSGGSLPAPEGEETLDVEWASGIAPGAKIRIYATGSLRFVDLDRALDRIIADLRNRRTAPKVSSPCRRRSKCICFERRCRVKPR